MQPLNTSSASNLERGRIESARAMPGAAAGGTAAGGFADLLRNAQADVPGAAVPLPETAPPATGRAAGDRLQAAQADRGEQAGRRDATPGSRQADAPVASADESSEQDEDDAPSTARGAGNDAPPTLAHWLMNGAPAAPMTDAAVPPPEGTAGATDDLDAAALTRDLLQGLRNRPGAGQAGADPRLRPSGDRAPAGGAGAAASGDAAAPAAATAPFVVGQGDEALRPALHAVSAGPGDVGAGMPAAASAPPLATTTAAAPSALPEYTVATPMDTPGFDTAAGITLARLAREGVHEARLQLNPAEMGPVTVRIEVQQGAARVDVAAVHAATRRAFEQAMPALAAALQADGLSLASGQVSALPPVAAAGGAARDGLAFDMGGQGAAGQGGGREQTGSDARPRDGWSSSAYGWSGPDGAVPSRDAAVRAGLAAWRDGRDGRDGLDLYA